MTPRMKGSVWGCRRAPLATVLGALLLSMPRPAAGQAPLGPAKMDSPVTLEQGAGFVLLDLTMKDDKTSPVIRMGYQSYLGDAVRRLRAANPERDIHNVPYYSVSLSGVPSGDVASIFGDGRVSPGGEVQLSFGQAYLLSTAVARNTSVLEANIEMLAVIANAIEVEKKTIGNEVAKTTPDTGKISTSEQNITGLAGDALRLKTFLEGKRDQAALTAHRLAYQQAVDYAQEIIEYARPGALTKPAQPDPSDALRGRGGPIYDAWFIRGGVSAGNATFFNASAAFGEQFTDEDYRGYSVQAGYSIRYGGRLPAIIAFSGGFARTSNVEELRSVEVAETQTFTSADGSTRRVINSKRTGLVGDLEQETRGTAKLDLVFYPGLAAASADQRNPRSTIAIDLFGRARGGVRTVYGIGAYVTQPGSPTNVYGGVNVYRAETGKLAIDLVAGFPF